MVEVVIEGNRCKALKSLTTLVIKKDFLGFLKEHFVYLLHNNCDGYTCFESVFMLSNPFYLRNCCVYAYR